MKLKEFGPQGARHRAPLDPPLVRLELSPAVLGYPCSPAHQTLSLPFSVKSLEGTLTQHGNFDRKDLDCSLAAKGFRSG